MFTPSYKKGIRIADIIIETGNLLQVTRVVFSFHISVGPSSVTRNSPWGHSIRFFGFSFYAQQVMHVAGKESLYVLILIIYNLSRRGSLLTL